MWQYSGDNCVGEKDGVKFGIGTLPKSGAFSPSDVCRRGTGGRNLAGKTVKYELCGSLQQLQSSHFTIGVKY